MYFWFSFLLEVETTGRIKSMKHSNEPTTFRFVAQCLKQLRHPCTQTTNYATPCTQTTNCATPAPKQPTAPPPAPKQPTASPLHPNNHCNYNKINLQPVIHSRSQWPRGLRRRSTAVRLLILGGSNPTGGMDICLL